VQVTGNLAPQPTAGCCHHDSKDNAHLVLKFHDPSCNDFLVKCKHGKKVSQAIPHQLSGMV